LRQHLADFTGVVKAFFLAVDVQDALFLRSKSTPSACAQANKWSRASIARRADATVLRS
jgi:hypothetical protein